MLFLGILVKLFKISLLPSIWIRNMGNLILKGLSVCRFRGILMKLFWICRDISLWHPMIKKYINMQGICCFRIVPMKTVFQHSAMEQNWIINLI